MRKTGILFAIAALLVTFRLVSRVADRRTAALACLVTATSSPFLVVHGMVIVFESLPWTLLAAALVIWSARPALFPGQDGGEGGATGSLSTRAAIGGAVFAGLSFIASVKMLFFAVPLLAIALRSGLSLRAVKRPAALAMGGIFLLSALPIALFAAIDPTGGFSGQMNLRGRSFLENLELRRVPMELWNFLISAMDMSSYIDQITTHVDTVQPWTLALAGVLLGYCAIVGVARLLGRRAGTPLAAACGVLITAYFGVGLLLYRQYPAANYTPLHSVLGAAMAAGAVAITASIRPWLERRGASRLARAPLALAIVVVLMGTNLWNLFRRGDPARTAELSFNAFAERAAGEALRAEPGGPGALLTMTYNHAGVFDTLGGARLRPIQTQEVFERCKEAPEGVDPCLMTQWRRILRTDHALPLRVIMPAVIAAVDHPKVVLGRVWPTLQAASQELGLQARLEQTFPTAGGVPVIALYRVDPAP